MTMTRTGLLVRIISYGALWGLAEASLGYVLHWINPFLPGIVIFPIGAAILVRLYGSTGSRSALFAAGLVAAALKAFDFLLPTIAPLRVTNPILCIVFEGLAMAFVAPALAAGPLAKRILLLPAASILWRVLFLAALFIEWPLLGTPSGQITSLAAMASFAVVSGLQSGAIAIAADHLVRRLPVRVSDPFAKPAFAAVLAVLAAVATVLLS